MITTDDYFMGRRERYASEFNDAIAAAAVVTVARANALLDAFFAAKPNAIRRHVNSGWRPPSLNATVPGASQRSLHMTGEAIDLSDDDSMLDDWINSPAGLQTLVRLELWAESRNYTPRWCHVQTRPPRSGLRFFVP